MKTIGTSIIALFLCAYVDTVSGRGFRGAKNRAHSKDSTDSRRSENKERRSLQEAVVGGKPEVEGGDGEKPLIIDLAAIVEEARNNSLLRPDSDDSENPTDGEPAVANDEVDNASDSDTSHESVTEGDAQEDTSSSSEGQLPIEPAPSSNMADEQGQSEEVEIIFEVGGRVYDITVTPDDAGYYYHVCKSLDSHMGQFFHDEYLSRNEASNFHVRIEFAIGDRQETLDLSLSDADFYYEVCDGIDQAVLKLNPNLNEDGLESARQEIMAYVE